MQRYLGMWLATLKSKLQKGGEEKGRSIQDSEKGDSMECQQKRDLRKRGERNKKGKVNTGQ